MKNIRNYHREAVLLINDEFVTVQGVYFEEGTIRVQHLFAVSDGDVTFTEGGLVVLDNELYQITSPTVDSESFGTPMIISAVLIPYVESEVEDEVENGKAVCPKCGAEWFVALTAETVVCPECGYDGKEDDEPVVVNEEAAIDDEKTVDENNADKTPAPDYASMTAKALYDLCVERGIEIEKRLSKEKYLEALGVAQG